MLRSESARVPRESPARLFLKAKCKKKYDSAILLFIFGTPHKSHRAKRKLTRSIICSKATPLAPWHRSPSFCGQVRCTITSNLLLNQTRIRTLRSGKVRALRFRFLSLLRRLQRQRISTRPLKRKRIDSQGSTTRSDRQKSRRGSWRTSRGSRERRETRDGRIGRCLLLTTRTI